MGLKSNKGAFKTIVEKKSIPIFSTTPVSDYQERVFSIKGHSRGKIGANNNSFKFMKRPYKIARPYRGKNGDPKDKWYAWYSFINPMNGRYKRIRVYEGLNYIDDLEEKELFLSELVKSINKALHSGHNPFQEMAESKHFVKVLEHDKYLEENPRSPLLLDAFADFLKAKKSKDLAKASIQAYQNYIDKFENYLMVNREADMRLDKLTTKFIGDMLDWIKARQKWNGSTYNNHLNFWALLLNWFARKPRKWIKRDDFDIGTDGELELKNTKVMKNQYFGDTVAEKVKEEMKAFPDLLFFSKFLYFSCMRPDEIRNLQIENIDIKGRYIKIVGKTKSRTVPVCDELADMLTELNLHKYPTSHYVIGKDGNVSNIMHSENYFTSIFREKIRKPLGLSENFTLYGFKHTRVVDLLNAGYNDTEVMNLTGHRDTESYDKYKRDLVNHIETRLKGKTIGWKK